MLTKKSSLRPLLNKTRTALSAGGRYRLVLSAAGQARLCMLVLVPVIGTRAGPCPQRRPLP